MQSFPSKISTVILLLLISAPITLTASEIGYQGRLTDSSGIAVTDTVSILFSLYDNDTGGSLLWSETQITSVINGLFSVILGSPVWSNLSHVLDPDHVPGDKWMEIKVGPDPPMSPRVKFTSSPYSVISEKAQSVSDNSIKSASIQNAAVTPVKLATTFVAYYMVAELDSSKFTNPSFVGEIKCSYTILPNPPLPTPPVGIEKWLFCDGKIYNIADYPYLYNVIGNYYGGDGITNFAVPDLVNTIPVQAPTGGK